MTKRYVLKIADTYVTATCFPYNFATTPLQREADRFTHAEAKSMRHECVDLDGRKVRVVRLRERAARRGWR